MAQKRLMQELQTLQKEKWMHVETDETNILHWKVGLWVVNPDSVWHGAYLRADMRFPSDYPYQPPSFRFLTKNICHPNVYPDGNLCISILHRPGDDEQSGESASERWNVLHGVESVLRSVLLLMDDPEIKSPANVDASVLYRDVRSNYDLKAKRVVAESQKDIPHNLRMPTSNELAPAPVKVVEDDADFWNMTDEEPDFGGSDSDQDFGDGEEEEEEEEEEDDDDDYDVEEAGTKR
ncbi:Ubiquitin-conjugating enzyme/RWD-like protein [Moelleriella libera RCEF 2490]|uniref:Ubiquitin-conjugating enzyme/RWD-like protein n=1 Tax=Moelleriella libera RCEF 2490 TaxID=1081109 RepID=A0A168E1Y5_9HYPO|nr:Ubiquitin-conjugating enzyme/RWD-like protein [Moelleriella libera RCEF 2490]